MTLEYHDLSVALSYLRSAVGKAGCQGEGMQVTIGFTTDRDMHNFYSRFVQSAPLGEICSPRWPLNLDKLMGFDLKFEVRKPETAKVTMPDGQVRYLRPGETLTIETKVKP